ncbi:extracellular solute-binding protein [Microbacterium aquimaris]|uniref:Extracellular solute-binding protein n=1 Tax=Microbacterium aquimaris TaxID=459816 RepID=A0ABU5N572_9MICO|nr:extracellular solute-binding protein [Microbacterium aquimaris]MDZ8161238.1 extracellular solute-binding protein [Microbacterium aquimaris]
MTIRTTRALRVLSPVAFVAAAGVALTGCAGSASADPATYVYEPGEEVVELEFWSAAVEDVNAEMAEMFNETRGEELGIRVNVTYQGDYFETEQKVYAAQLADTMPNVFVDEVGMTKGFQEGGVALNLTPYLEANGIDDEDFQIGATGNLYIDGDMYALPYMRSVPVMYVNGALLEDYGFDAEGPETLAEMDEILRTISADTGEPAMVLPNYDLWVLEALMYSYGDAAVLSEDFDSSNLDDPGAVATAAWLGDLIDAGAVRHTGPTELQEFIASVTAPTTAVTLTSSGAIQTLQGMAGEAGIDLTVALFPAGEDDNRGVSVGGSNLYVADTGTDEEKAAAFEFARWATDTEQAAYTSAATGYVAVRESSQDTELLQETFAANPAYEVATEQLSYGRTRPMGASYTEIQQLIIERLAALWADGGDPEQAMADLSAEVDEILNR